MMGLLRRGSRDRRADRTNRSKPRSTLVSRPTWAQVIRELTEAHEAAERHLEAVRAEYLEAERLAQRSKFDLETAVTRKHSMAARPGDTYPLDWESRKH